MTPSSAIQFAKLIEKYKPMWFEEPVPPSNFDSMGFVAKNWFHTNCNRGTFKHQI